MRSRNVRNPDHIPYASARTARRSPAEMRAAQIERVEACRIAAVARLSEFDRFVALAPQRAEEINRQRAAYLAALNSWANGAPYARVPKWSVDCQSALWLAQLASGEPSRY